MQKLSCLLWALCITVVHAGISQDRKQWSNFASKTVTVMPEECSTVSFRPYARARYRMEVVIEDLPPGCEEDDLKVTSRAHYNGECLVEDGDDLLCNDSNAVTYKSGEDVCDHWEDLQTTSYSRANSFAGSFCINFDEHYLAFRSSCNDPVNVTVQVDTRPFNDEEEETCKALEAFIEHAVRAFVFGGIVMLVVFVLVPTLIIVGIVLCCCCCPGCPCYESRKRRQGAQTGQAVQMQPVHQQPPIYGTGQTVTGAPHPGYAPYGPGQVAPGKPLSDGYQDAPLL